MTLVSRTLNQLSLGNQLWALRNRLVCPRRSIQLSTTFCIGNFRVVCHQSGNFRGFLPWLRWASPQTVRLTWSSPLTTDGPTVCRPSSNDTERYVDADVVSLLALVVKWPRFSCFTIFGHVDMTVHGHILTLRWCPENDFHVDLLSENIGSVHRKVSSFLIYKRTKPKCQFCIQICRTVKGQPGRHF